MTGDSYWTTTCPGCGAQIDGLHNRYVCGICGWVSPPEDDTPPSGTEE
ncbi:hypothetical protein [Streptomyces sp. 8N706]